jgi:hypothetical protein
MDIRYSKLREAGRFEHESYSELKYNDNALPTKFDIGSCYVVYGDCDVISHSVRIFKYDGE